MDKRPIGIFDSGIGGLTVAAQLNKLLPNEDIIYFGDTAHLPYGDKSKHGIKNYGLGIAEYLKTKDIKALVIACNTASAHAYKAIEKKYRKEFPIINVIDPMVDFAASKRFKKVGIIATKGTIKSRVYPTKFKAVAPKVKVSSSATPLLCPMIEEGYFNNNISRTIIHDYLDKPNLKKIDALVLGCTHYPLIKNEIASFYKREVEVLDSSEVVAAKVAQILKSGNRQNGKKHKGKVQIFVSDFTKAFEKTAKLFLPGEFGLEEDNIWG